MTRGELAAWCVNVTDEREDMALIHDKCGGEVEWTDISNVDEDYVCQKCGQMVDGEAMTAQTPLEAVRSAYDARQHAETVLRDRTHQLASAIRTARETHSLAEIAQELGVSRQRIHQISEEK